MSDVFISYSRKDIAFARLIRENLQQCQLDTWIDWDRIPVGERWWQEICEAIQNANVFMFIISRSSIGSPVCRDEIELAMQNHKRIIPIVVDDLKPEDIQAFIPDLPQYNWIIFEKDHIFQLKEVSPVDGGKPEDRLVALPKLPQFEQALERLNKAIHLDWEWIKFHTRLQVDALRWESNQKDPGYLLRGAALDEAEQGLFRAAGKEPQPSEVQVLFVTASRQEETQRQTERLQLEQKSRRRQRLALWAVGTGLMVALVLGFVAWGQRNQYLDETLVRATAEARAVGEAEARATAQVDAEIASTQAVQERDEAERQAALAISSGLSAQSRNYLDSQYDLSLLLAAQAFSTADTYAARDSLLTALQRQPRLEAMLYTAKPFMAMAFSPNGKILAGVYCSEIDENNACTATEVQLLEMSTRQPIGNPIPGVKGPLKFTADGGNLILRRSDGQLATLNIQTSQITNLPFADNGYSRNLELSPDGSLLALGGCSSWSLSSGLCGGAALRVWDFASGELVFETDDANVYHENSFEFSPDGQALAFSSCAEITTNPSNNPICIRGGVSVWDASSNKLVVHPVGEAAVLNLAFNPDGSQLVAGNQDGRLIFLDSTTWEESTTRLESGSNIEGLEYLPDGSRLVSASFDGPIQVWDLKTGRPAEELRFEISRNTMMVNPQGGLVAESGCSQYNNSGFICLQGVVLLWDTSSNPALGRVYTQINTSDWRNSEYLSPDAKRLALAECVRYGDLADYKNACIESEIKIVDTLTGELVGKSLTGLPSEVTAAVFSADGNQLVTVSCRERQNMVCDQSQIESWDVQTGEALTGPFYYEGWILEILLSPDAKTLYFEGQDDGIERLDLQNNRFAGEPLEGAGLSNMAFSPDGKILVTAGCVYFTQTCLESQIEFRDAQSYEPAAEPIRLVFDQVDVSSFGVSTLAFNPQGNLLAIATKSSVRFYDLERMAFRDLVLPVYGIISLEFNQAGDTLAIYSGKSGSGGSLVLWDMARAQPVGSTYPVDFRDTNQFGFSLDHRQLIASDGIAWDVDPLSWQRRACQIANRNLTQAEWSIFLGNQPYQKTCPNLP